MLLYLEYFSTAQIVLSSVQGCSGKTSTAGRLLVINFFMCFEFGTPIHTIIILHIYRRRNSTNISPALAKWIKMTLF